MKDLFGNEIEKPFHHKTNKKGPNPMVLGYGPGPEGKKCKSCIHLYGKRMTKTYYKCGLRRDTNGPATDHKVNWPSCSKYVEDAD